MRQVHANKDTHGFTLIELLVVISIISLLIAILLPALSKARQAAQVATCMSNEKQIGVLIYMYVGDNEDWLPCGHTHGASGNPQYSLSYTSGFAYDLRPYIPSYPVLLGSMFDCPSLDSSDYGNPNKTNIVEYAWNFEFMGGVDWYNGSLRNSYGPRRRMNEMKRTSDVLLFTERPNGSGGNDSGWKINRYDYPQGRHGEPNSLTANTLFLDGHAENVKWDLLYTPRYTLDTFINGHWWNPEL